MPYQQALDNTGYKHKLVYEKPSEQTSKKCRKRNVIWYNPPYSKSVKGNIGKKFLRIVDECFPKSPPLSKILNRQTLKLSYSCMPNMKTLISKSNNKKFREILPSNEPDHCNCAPNNCDVDGQCHKKSVVYCATVVRHDNGSKQTYTGLTEQKLKDRIRKHKSDFRKEADRGSTSLSAHIWDLKDKDVGYGLTWKILARAGAYHPASKICNLCNTEVYYILKHKETATLNKRKELRNKCRHISKFKLSKN